MQSRKNELGIHEIEDLHTSNYGKVSYCRDCLNVQIEFGNLVRSFNHENFVELIKLLREKQNSFLTIDDENLTKPIVFCFPYSDAYYCFSKKEWKQFYTLLMDAGVLFDIKTYLYKEGLIDE